MGSISLIVSKNIGRGKESHVCNDDCFFGQQFTEYSDSAFFFKSQAIAGSERHLATVVCSRSSTKAVVTTDVQERTTIDHGVLLQAITIGIGNGATVLVSLIVTKYGILFTLELNLAQ